MLARILEEEMKLLGRDHISKTSFHTIVSSDETARSLLAPVRWASFNGPPSHSVKRAKPTARAAISALPPPLS